jgi:hypothetical protein
MGNRVDARAIERGDAESIEFIPFVFPLVLLITLITVTAATRSAQVPVWAAARECARSASTASSQGEAVNRGQRFALSALRNSGIRRSALNVTVTRGGGRNASVTCTVEYAIDVGKLPLIAELKSDGRVVVRSSYTLNAEPFRDRSD